MSAGVVIASAIVSQRGLVLDRNGDCRRRMRQKNDKKIQIVFVHNTVCFVYRAAMNSRQL